MHVRVVRFTDVDTERLHSRLSDQGDSGPPEGVKASKVQICHDPDQRTAVVIQWFDSAEDMSASEQALDSMDPGDTPGTRASVDRCEVEAEFTP